MTTGKNITGIWVDEMVEYQLLVTHETAYKHDYWTVEPYGWVNRGFEWIDMRLWCTATFGPEGTVWTESNDPAQRWFANSGKFWFSSEQDKDWFILRWS